MQTFVLLNLYKETGRHSMVSAAYYLTVADLMNAGVAVNRDVAVVPVIAYQTFMSIVFRLEVSRGEQLQRSQGCPSDVPLAGRARDRAAPHGPRA